MSRFASRLVLLVVSAFLLAVLAIGALAALGDPQILFSDNIDAVGTSLAITEMEQVLLNKLNAATSSISGAIYDFDRSSIRDALLAAKGRGVDVRIVTDDDAYTSDLAYFVALQNAGIPVIQDNLSSIMHNKFFVIDGEVVWTGSTNMSNTDISFNHNNTAVFTSTLLADIFTLEFDEMFGGAFSTNKTDNVTHTLTYNGLPLEVYFSPTDGAMPQLLDEVNAAAETIEFSIFFFTEDDLRDALIARAQAGVEVVGVWDLLGAANQYSDDEALCAAGIPIKIEDFGGKMHNKFMVLDANGAAPRVITGSMNWTAAGEDANDENTLVIHDPVVAQAYLAAFQELWDALGPETLCQTGLAQEVYIYLPVAVRPLPSPTPTSTPTPSATPLPSPTPTGVPATATPSPTPTQGPGNTGNVDIINIFYDGTGTNEPDEYVEIRNADTIVIQLQGWTLRDEANHVYTFPSFLIQPNQICRVYTNENHPEWCGFNYGSGTAIWNNSGDCAYLRDGVNQLIDTYCY